VRAYPRHQRHRQLDREHRGRLRHPDRPVSGRPIHIPAGLPLRQPEPTRQLTSGVSHPNTGGQQLSGRVDPRGVLLATRPTTTSHDINILPAMSQTIRDTRQTLQPAVTQRHLKTEVALCVGGVISPLLSNIYLHVLDAELSRRGVGELVRYADDGVVLCRSRRQAQRALDAVGEILAGLGLRLHPGKTRIVDLRDGREGFDFLGCHFRARMSGRLWEQKRVRRYYLHRWPSQRAMKRFREKVKARTGRNRVGVKDIRIVIEDLNPILRGWGNYFRTGNAAKKFRQVDYYVVQRLHNLMIKKRGRNLRAGQTRQWSEDWFNGLGLHRLRGTIRYPKTA
jgi:RNA-directed DNA polymerase